MINSFPYSDGENPFQPISQRSNKIYSFVEDCITYIKVDYYLNPSAETYNIAVIGPTGAGKSRLINVLFNRDICVSRQDHESVTQDSSFIHGYGNVFNRATKTIEQRHFIIADTVGLCDTKWNKEDLIELVKGRVSSNFTHLDMVVIMYKADRLTQDLKHSIREILKWLKYGDVNNETKFIFVATFAEDTEDEDIARLKFQAVNIFELKSSNRPGYKDDELVKLIFYLGFPKERSFDKQRQTKISNFVQDLRKAIFLQSEQERLCICEPSSSCQLL